MSARRRKRQDDVDLDVLRAYDELRARVAEIEALAFAASQIVLPFVADREKRRDLGRLDFYVARLAELAREVVDDAETTAAELMRARRPPAG